MGVGYNPGITTSGLVYAYDAANQKSLNIPTQADHGWADWVCLVSGTATYSIVDAGVTIYQRTSAGVVTSVVGPSTGPTRGSLSITAGNTYYSLGGPINLIVEDAQHSIVPTTMAGILFWHTANRNAPLNLYVYAPFSTASVNLYDNVASGISSAASNTITVAQGTSNIFYSSNLNNGVSGAAGQTWITANVPIIAAATMTGTDKTILSPMTNYVYRRFAAFIGASTNSFATTVSTTAYTIYDTVNKVMDMNIADGAGGDSNQGLGLEYLSDMYSWGNYLSDYVIATPYPNTVINVEYYDTTNSAWRLLESHSLSGTITNAAGVSRDGTAGVGNTATNISGAAAYFNTSQIWRWTGTNPFFVAINDTLDDEVSLLGWRKSTYSTKPRSGNTWINMITGNDNLTIVGGAISNNSTLSFNDNQVTQYCVNTSFPYPIDDSTMEIWFYKKGNGQQAATITYSIGGDNQHLSFFPAETTFSAYSFTNVFSFTVSSIANSWVHLARTRVKTTGIETYYINGTQIGTGTSAPGTSLTPNGALIVGQESDAPMSSGGGFDANQNLDGNVGKILIYNRALSAQEIKENFNASRGRYGL